ncbi:MAG: ABC transporter permease subunit [Verrucomicrobia bacterium]|nr:ABC transporter permease subunit [Verrucomicrobiota bacterium]
METSDKKPAPVPAPESRFTVSPMTLAADRWMGRLIRFGGVGVVLAVFGMLAFLIFQVFPLFTGANVTAVGSLSVPANAVAFGEDEYGDFPYVVLADGKVVFQRAADGAKAHEWAPSLGALQVTAVRSYPRAGLVFLGLSDGSVQELQVAYRSTFDAAGKRAIEPVVTALAPVAIGKPGVPCLEVWNAKGSQSRLMVVRQADAGKPLLTAVRLTERKGLGGKARVTVSPPFVVAADAASIEKVLLPSTAESLIVVGKSGEVRTYADDGAAFAFLQSFVPFKDSKDPAVASAGLIFGNVSVVFVGRSGEQQVWSMYPQVQPDGKSLRRWGKIHDGEALAGAGEGVYAAEGNKCYLAVAGGKLQIRNMTTGSLRWEGDAPSGSIRQLAFAGNYDRFTALSADGKLHRWSIVDHHPESSWGAFFGKIWYEGASGPAYTWQSSAGSDEFEAKYSLVPLFYGTVKGTFYALLFALPIALTAAIYVSQFLRPEYRQVVKPVMEIMASLPSVVLGFLAGLWLAPLVDPRLISLFCAVGILAPAALFAGFLWSALPQPIRRQVKPGMEFLWLLPFLALCAFAAWKSGPAVEAAFFTVKDTASGLPIADFREWWRQTTGATYDSRNSLVVGFVMGFAVIPIVFTIAEDALSNVPNSLVSGSLALGASRWQTVWSVVVPTAISGIVSGIMIGFGRAIGETMIVVMATGNTAVMESNPFSGMRTLSANIAVELPEAAAGHTHYRALFLGACCLFLLTFVINTLAEVLRQRLRERYKVV